MHFTLVFSSHESYDLTLSLTFEPCPIWRRGGILILNPHPLDPAYRKGDFSAVMRFLGTEFSDGFASSRRRVLVIKHATGHGSCDDLELLLSDIGIMSKTQSESQA